MKKVERKMYRATWTLVNGATNEGIGFAANFESYIAAETCLKNMKEIHSDVDPQTGYFVEDLRIDGTLWE